MHRSVIPLAAGFPPASRERWRALVERTLEGAGVETLVSEGADGLRIEALYAADGAAAPVAFVPAPRGGGGWDIRAVIDHPDPAEATVRVAAELAGGARSLLVRLDPSARAGVAVGAAEGLERLLRPVRLEETAVALDAGFIGVTAGGWLAAAAKASPTAKLALHLDPLSAFAEMGASPGPIESHLIAAAGLAARLAEPYPEARFFLASGRVAHEAGGGQGWELALMAAAAVAYAKAMVRAGLAMPAAFGRITLGLAVDTDPLVSIAKLRAARILWARITGACGVEAPAVIEARSSARMLTSGDPWTNLVRLTAAGFAGAVGGADSLVLAAFTDALGLATPFARRLSRNTQLVLMEEAHLGRVADPVGGAWAFEALTRELAQAAWASFTAIEAAGGAVEALRSGLIAEEVAAGRSALAARVAAGEMKIVGVTDFAQAPDRTPEVESSTFAPVEAPSPRLPGPDSHCPALAPIRLEALAA